MNNTSKPRAKRKKESTPKKIVVLDFYRDIRTFKMREATNSYLENLCEALVEWARKPDSIALIDFCTEAGIAKHSLDFFSTKYENVKEAKALAQELIACHRETGAIKGKLNATAVLAFQGMRDPEFKEYLAWKASLNQKEEAKSEQKVVIIERYPEEKE